jgi:hypothetical protein
MLSRVVYKQVKLVAILVLLYNVVEIAPVTSDVTKSSSRNHHFTCSREMRERGLLLLQLSKRYRAEDKRAYRRYIHRSSNNLDYLAISYSQMFFLL